MASPLKFLRSPEVGIVQASFSGGQHRDGVEDGPAAVLAAGVVQQIHNQGWATQVNPAPINYESLRPLKEHDPNIGKLRYPRYVSSVCELIAKEAETHARAGRFVLTIGGDHSVALGSITGIARAYPDLGVIWVDAHADLNTPESTPSGNLHGIINSLLTGLAPAAAPFEWVGQPYDHRRLVYIGLRDVDAGERKLLKQYGIKAFSMHEVDKHGIGSIMQQALDYLSPQRDRPIHVSFDIDAVDPEIAPATGTPVRGGLSFRESHYLNEAVFESGCIVSLDMVEINPHLATCPADREKTVSMGCSLIRAALGETLL